MNKISILVVDDENFVCENIKLKLKRLKHPCIYEVTTCNSARQALTKAAETNFSIIFTDIRMPFVSGLTLIKQLRESSYTNKILVLSGYDDFDSVRTAFLNGADDYILKPVDISELGEKLLKYTSERETPKAEAEIEEDLIAYAIRYINEHYHNATLNMSEVAAHISLSYSHFSSLFRTKTDMTFPSFLLQIRVKKAIELLGDPSMKIGDICYKVGFKYPQQFSRDFKKVTGVYPSDYWNEKNNPAFKQGEDTNENLD